MEWLKDLVYSWKGRSEMIETENNGLRLGQEEEVAVWICSIRDPALSEESSFQSIVDRNANEKESEAIRKFLFLDDRRRSLCSLVLQKALIQRTFADVFVGGQKYCISRTRENKPFLAKESFPRPTQNRLKRWNYNVSHHGDFVGIVSSFTHLVGVDIVDTHTRSSFAKTPAEYVNMFREQLTTYEMDYILDSSLGETQQYQRFFIFWALKEAFIKAIGQGLGYDLKKVEFHVQYRRRHARGDEHEDSAPGECQADTCWWTGEAEVWINGQHRHDWHCAFLPLDEDKESSEPRHLMAVALGPWQEALPSYQDAAWFPMVRTSEAVPTLVREAVFPPVRETFVAVTELLTAIHAGDA